MSDRITVKVDIDQGALAAAVGPILRRRMASLTRRIANQARQDVPVRTGNLGRSIKEEPVTMAGPFRVESGVVATADYAAAVHNGISHSYVIVPRRAKALRFEVGGRVVFARRVVHPPMKARPFLLNAARRIAAEER